MSDEEMSTAQERREDMIYQDGQQAGYLRGIEAAKAGNANVYALEARIVALEEAAREAVRCRREAPFALSGAIDVLAALVEKDT